MSTAAVILAAGASTRFGSAKHDVRIGGRTMLEHVAAAARDAGLAPVIAVVPPDRAVPSGIVAAVNDAPEQGISRSVRLGLSAVPDDVDAAVLLLGDEPLVGPAQILQVLLAAAMPDTAIVATRAVERIGPPVFLRRDRFDLADRVEGDEGLGRLLRRQADVVLVETEAAPTDVDTVAQLDAIAPRCVGCGARFLASVDGPTHEYMLASPGCWAAFTELIAREFGDPAYGALHRHAVDAYAVQHPGIDDRRARQSVAVHLIGLCQWLEHGVPAEALTRLTQALTTEPRDWPWLEPPDSYAVTAVDVLAAEDGANHLRLVREWAASAWASWSAHHVVVRRWAADSLASQDAR